MEKACIFLHKVSELAAQFADLDYGNSAELFPFYNHCNCGSSETETLYFCVSNVPTCRIESSMFSDDISEFAIKIRNMRLNCNMTAVELSQRTGINVATISRYENETFSYDKVDVDRLSALAIACGQDADYLLTPFLKFKKYHKQILQQYLIDNNISKSQLAILCNVSYTLVKTWFNKEKRSPSQKLWQTTFMDYSLNWFEQQID